MKEGEPTYVVALLDNEERLENKLPETERINQDITEWSNKETATQNEISAEKEAGNNSENKGALDKDNSQEVRIEDLPF